MLVLAKISSTARGGRGQKIEQAGPGASAIALLAGVWSLAEHPEIPAPLMNQGFAAFSWVP